MLKLFAVLFVVVVAGAEEVQQQQQLHHQQQQQHQFVEVGRGEEVYYPSYKPSFQDRNGAVGISGGVGVAPLDLSSYSPGNLITTMIYTLGILSLVNLLLGLIPEADTAAAAKAVIENREDVVEEKEEEGEGVPEGRSLGLASMVLGAIQRFEETYQ